MKNKRKTRINYAKWGYRFVIPFVVVYVVFSLIPLLSTFFYSFFEYYFKFGGLEKVGPNFNFLDNYILLFTEGKFFKYFGNTMLIWIMGFIPQVIVSLLLALWFSSTRLNIKAQGFFKTIVYMPNLVMAAAFSLLFLKLFSNNGPVTNFLFESNIIGESFSFVDQNWSTRGLLSFMNYLMWFGNTTILLMAGIMGIDKGILESAQVDGANTIQTFFRIVLPLLRPILLFVLVTSLVGGVQLFDLPQIFTAGSGGPEMGSMTVIMYISRLLGVSKQYGLAGAASTLLFIMTAIVSLGFFFIFYRKEVIPRKSIREGEDK
ncbi:MAG: sugar ABC transporter permease [Candidatus Izemoplasmatales bacterium]|nr:sugar ABC transporter permease [Candidatus Izemoplasmatales bacterium]MDD4069564.1 sugar ABC transporter permease [Candidatus Izemoplasmatales bacterium]MDY0138869.1 sugar ABC transporter permease [Candidatus Izemoplasmatales bacterium]